MHFLSYIAKESRASGGGYEVFVFPAEPGKHLN